MDKGQKALRLKLHATIQKMTDDMGRRMHFNTAIASAMELVNELSKYKDDSPIGRGLLQEAFEKLVLLLAPMSPHISQKLWQDLGKTGLVIDVAWPSVDKQALVKDEIEMMVQVNGKLRSKIEVASNAEKETILATAKSDEQTLKFIEGKEIIKEIVVPGRLVNLVVK